jgi:hypothetical protein
VNIDGRTGVVFERIYGETILKRFVDRTTERAMSEVTTNEFDDYIDAKITARLLFQIHSHSVVTMTSQRENIKNDILRTTYWTENEKEAVINQLDKLPVKHQLCHGEPNQICDFAIRFFDALITAGRVEWGGIYRF